MKTSEDKPVKIDVAREELRECLSRGIVNVQFTKKDGTPRLMVCTRKTESIPEDKRPSGNSTRKVNDAVEVVFDTEKNEWRSFRYDSITEWYAGPEDWSNSPLIVNKEQ